MTTSSSLSSPRKKTRTISISKNRTNSAALIQASSNAQNLRKRFSLIWNELFSSGQQRQQNKIGNNLKVTKRVLNYKIDQVLRRVKEHREYSAIKTEAAPNGTFAGRPIISEGSKISGGVYISPLPREALVVDERHGSLELIYSQMMVNHVRENGSKRMAGTESELVKRAMEAAQKKLTFVPEETIDMLGKSEALVSDEKVALDVFLEHGLGTSRHLVLLAGYLLEKLKERGYLHGKIHIDGETRGRYTFFEKLIYETESGELFIFDPSII